MKKFLILIFTVCMSTMIVPFSFADSLEIIPEAKNPDTLGADVDCVAGSSSDENCKQGTVRDRYNTKSDKYCKGKSVDLGAAFGTGIFSWDCIIEYIVYIIKFLSQLGLLVGIVMIIYAGYQYATAVPSPDSIKNAIIGVLVVIFAYAIIKILTAMFL